LSLAHKAAAILTAFREADIPVVVLKGLHLAETVYADPAQRPMCDIDLLIPLEQFPLATAILARLKYQPTTLNFSPAHYKELGFRAGPGAPYVEVHWHISGTSQNRIRIEGLWERSRPARVAGVECLVLCPEDLVLHLCHHALADQFNHSLRVLCDLDRVINRHGSVLDWDQVVCRSREWGIDRGAFLIFQFARSTLQMAVPDGVIEALRPPDCPAEILRATEEAFVRVDSAREFTSALANFDQAHGLGARIVMAWQRIFLTRAVILSQYLPSHGRWALPLGYGLRLSDLWRRHWRKLWRMSVGNPEQRAILEKIQERDRLLEWVTKTGH
jgi:hypothetical protein